MNASAIAVLALAAGVAVADWVAVFRDKTRAIYWLKPLTLVCVIAAALAVEPASELQRRLFVGALVFGLIGDILLMLPRDAFLQGLFAFLIGHVFYIAGLMTLYESRAAAVAGLVAIAIVAAAPAMIVAKRALQRRGGRVLAPAIVVYALALTLLVASAAGAMDLIAVCAATLFVISDGIIGWSRFVSPLPHARLAIIVTYHAAQAGFVMSLVN